MVITEKDVIHRTNLHVGRLSGAVAGGAFDILLLVSVALRIVLAVITAPPWNMRTTETRQKHIKFS
jgi:hypothetical protein